jgi:Cu(I)/Ag(I) efflux system membrane fusion protein/cobalt-zinc-cadmium efflux system membrane fusion protein
MITIDTKLKIRASEKAGQRGGAVVRAVLWALAGALVMLLLVADPLGVSPVDGWLGIERHADVGHEEGHEHEGGLWTCGMHPQVIEDEPGQCPICGMDLVPLRQDDGHVDGLWTCGMHPQVIEEEPGQCPICGMDLVPLRDEGGGGAVVKPSGEREILFYRNPMDPTITSPVPRKDDMGMDYVPVYAEEAESVAADGAVVTINPAVQQKMNVVTERVRRRDISHRIRTVGYLDYDQEKMVSVTTKYSGFIEKTYVNYIGQPVKKGEPLFEIYAPELVQTEQELLSALRYATVLAAAPEDTRRRAEALLEAARMRLAYWDISDEQVQRLEETGKVFRTLQVTAPASGVVMKRMPGLEGMAVRPGMELLHIADLSDLWLTVEIFEDQLPWLDVGSTATVTMTYFPGEIFHGRVRYIEPEVAQKTRTIQLTLEVPNPGSRLRVGMYATVVFEPVAARNAIAVPSQAVLRTGERNVVIVALGDGRFAPREVRLGPQGEGFVQVLEGLSDGDEIVTSAQFLIDSESNLREAIQKMIAAKRAAAEGGGE